MDDNEEIFKRILDEPDFQQDGTRPLRGTAIRPPQRGKLGKHLLTRGLPHYQGHGGAKSRTGLLNLRTF
jgi:hypothetical protein